MHMGLDHKFKLIEICTTSEKFSNMGKYILSNQKEGKIAAERFLVPVMFHIVSL
jgi:hypothetical protein